MSFKNALEFRAAFNKEKHAQPSRAKSGRKLKAVAQRQPAVVRSPIQPDSFMASARGLPSGPSKMPQKRSRIEEQQEVEDMQALQARKNNDVVVVRNNPVFESNDESAGPGHQACREK